MDTKQPLKVAYGGGSIPLHYSDLTTYWECPRRWSYQRVGWRPHRLPDAMLRGLLVDRGVAAAWKGQSLRVGVADEVVLQLQYINGAHPPDAADLQAKVRALGLEAISMAGRYMQQLGVDLEPILVATTVTKDSPAGLIAGTPDCVAMHEGRRVLVELKTGQDPNPRMYRMTGQADFYAYLLGDIDLVYYDLVSPNNVMRYRRPPRKDRGEYLVKKLIALAQLTQRMPAWDAENPRYGWWCARCPFLEACQTHDDWGDDEEVLLSTMWREERKG